MFQYQQLKNVCVRTLGSLTMALNGFSVLLFVPSAPEVLTEITRIIYTAFYPLIYQLELP